MLKISHPFNDRTHALMTSKFEQNTRQASDQSRQKIVHDLRLIFFYLSFK